MAVKSIEPVPAICGHRTVKEFGGGVRGFWAERSPPLLRQLLVTRQTRLKAGIVQDI